MDQQEDYRLLGDQPCIKGEDALGFEEIATELAALIRASAASSPFTVGIEGGWGEGKSSLMGRIAQKLSEPLGGEVASGEVKVETVRFNAWTAGDGDVLEGLVKSVLEVMDDDVLRRLARRKKMISWLRLSLTFLAHLIRLGSIVEQIWEELKVDPKARNEMRNLLSEALLSWREAEIKLGRDRLLVVFVDDLDRCSPGSVFQVFEAMKLYLDAPGLAFVVGFDREMVSQAVSAEKGYGGEKIRSYLEKVIQTRYEIPPATPEAGQRLMRICVEASGTESVFDEDSQQLVIDRNDHNPRRIKRFINSFILQYRLSESNQLAPAELIWVLILKFYFPDFVKLLLDSREDPRVELLEYAEAKELLFQVQLLDPEQRRKVSAIFETRGLSAPNLDGPRREKTEHLNALEAELHDQIAPLVAATPTLPSLVKELEGLRYELLKDALRRQPAAELSAPPPSPPREREFASEPPAAVDGARLEAPSAASLRGLRVLWISDDEEGEAPFMVKLKASGASVQLVADLERARNALEAHTPDAVLSDITRGGDRDAGLRDLKLLRERLYDGPILLFTSRVTASRRAVATENDAVITSSWSDVFAFLEQIAVDRAPEPPRVAYPLAS